MTGGRIIEILTLVFFNTEIIFFSASSFEIAYRFFGFGFDFSLKTPVSP